MQKLKDVRVLDNYEVNHSDKITGMPYQSPSAEEKIFGTRSSSGSPSNYEKIYGQMTMGSGSFDVGKFVGTGKSSKKSSFSVDKFFSFDNKISGKNSFSAQNKVSQMLSGNNTNSKVNMIMGGGIPKIGKKQDFSAQMKINSMIGGFGRVPNVNTMMNMEHKMRMLMPDRTSRNNESQQTIPTYTSNQPSYVDRAGNVVTAVFDAGGKIIAGGKEYLDTQLDQQPDRPFWGKVNLQGQKVKQNIIQSGDIIQTTMGTNRAPMENKVNTLLGGWRDTIYSGKVNKKTGKQLTQYNPSGHFQRNVMSAYPQGGSGAIAMTSGTSSGSGMVNMAAIPSSGFGFATMANPRSTGMYSGQGAMQMLGQQSGLGVDDMIAGLKQQPTMSVPVVQAVPVQQYQQQQVAPQGQRIQSPYSHRPVTYTRGPYNKQRQIAYVNQGV